jgi:hypothetical protein
MANVRPAWPITLVLAAKSMSACTGPGRSGSPNAAATVAERTDRLRYHSARPSRILMPWTMPSPVNQWYAAGSGEPMGLGPLRRYRPSSTPGSVPVTGSSRAVTSSVTGP